MAANRTVVSSIEIALDHLSASSWMVFTCTISTNSATIPANFVSTHMSISPSVYQSFHLRFFAFLVFIHRSPTPTTTHRHFLNQRTRSTSRRMRPGASRWASSPPVIRTSARMPPSPIQSSRTGPTMCSR